MGAASVTDEVTLPHVQIINKEVEGEEAGETQQLVRTK